VAAPRGQRLVRQVMMVSVAALAAYTRIAATLVLRVEVRCLYLYFRKKVRERTYR
jgi:hypothetical protein